MVRKKKKLSATRRLHRTLGASAAAFVLFMALSGLTINHARGLGLDQRHVSQSFLLDWYGLHKPKSIRSFLAGGHWLSFAGSALYLDGKSVATLADGVGAVFHQDMLIAAGAEELLLLDRSGELIERIPWNPPGPDPIVSIGQIEDGTVAVKSSRNFWLADAQMLRWQLTEEAITPAWSEPARAPEDVQRAITQQYRGTGPSWERLLLDLHSGRIFGTAGVLVYDLLALVVGFLAISGLVLWVKGRRNGKRK